MKHPSEFLQHIQASGGFLRTNKFEVMITPPEDVTIDNDSLTRICTNVISAKIPGSSIDTKIWNQGGNHVRKMANTKMYTDLSLRFRVSEDLLEKRFFDAWMSLIIDPVYHTLNYYDKYASSVISVKPLTRVINNSNNNGFYLFYECWPINVMDIDVSMEEENSVAILSVDFAFRGYTYEQE